MSVISWQQCLYVFISNSTEDRHLKDIAFGATVLIGKGVSNRNIVVFTDDPRANGVLSAYGADQIYPLADVETVLQGLTFEHVLVTITGHGAPNGIGGNLGPANLCSYIRSIQNLHSGIVVLCQCYAGVFNYVLASANPQLVFLGATNLTSSLSSSVSILDDAIYTSLGQWSANLFMFYFFSWIHNPVDIDGDGHLTILDAYKFAGAYSHESVAKVKGGTFTKLQELYVTLLGLKYNQQLQPSLHVDMEIDATQTLIENNLQIIHVSQEPWLLHANLAREMVIV